MISIIPPPTIKGMIRAPTHICCVIDISGSMGSEARIINGNQSEGHGLSILDLVKHAVRTIIQSLEDNDSLSIVAFTTEARVIIEEISMADEGKARAESALENLQPENSTNIWDGLYKALELTRSSTSGKNSAIFLLTDGEPNVIPPRGHLPMLQKYRDEHGISSIINTFGFGYSLDSNLLHELAAEGNGTYAFIPDASFVGTIFVNALSNLLSTAATNVKLSVEIPNSIKSDYSLLQHYKHHVTSWGIEVQLGSVLFGQAKNLVIPFTLEGSKTLGVTLEYYSPFEKTTHKFSNTVPLQVIDSHQIEIQKLRLQLVNEVMGAFKLKLSGSAEALKLIHNLASKIKASSVVSEAYIKDLLKDLEGEITMALDLEKNFNRWGVHFVPSITRTHLLQQCNNFKDPGVQHYGGETFQKIRNVIDDIFVKLPPPKPSLSTNSQLSDMSIYYNSSGGCIAGDCLVTMADGSLKFVKDIVKGDLVLGRNGETVKVVCVVKTACENQRAKLVKFESGLKITPWHPVKLGEKFSFPCMAEIPFSYEEFENCAAVYNFVLESHHLMMVDGIECITLGHGFEEDVAKHEYFGTSAVIEDLKKIEGWESGLVELIPTNFMRDSKTGMVSSLSQNKEQFNGVIFV